MSATPAGRKTHRASIFGFTKLDVWPGDLVWVYNWLYKKAGGPHWVLYKADSLMNLNKVPCTS